MEQNIIITKDGSHTIAIPAMAVTYHSLHGAIQESMHVFIQAGLQPLLPAMAGRPLHILEIGFGTGLNALLTIIEAGSQSNIHYTTLETHPLSAAQARALNYTALLDKAELQPCFNLLHECDWEKQTSITQNFQFLKTRTGLLDVDAFFANQQIPFFDLVYFDAFAPAAQPELWTQEAFEKLYRVCSPGAKLVTYCSKSVVRRAMQDAGFTVKKIQGPRGKREMVRAEK